MLRNTIYIGQIESPECGVSSRGDFEPLVSEQTFYRAQAVAESIEELDVQGILAFAERFLPRAADLWVQASLNQEQRLQQLFLPEGIAFDGNRFSRTAATAPFFKYLAPSEGADEKMVSRTGIEPRAKS